MIIDLRHIFSQANGYAGPLLDTPVTMPYRNLPHLYDLTFPPLERLGHLLALPPGADPASLMQDLSQAMNTAIAALDEVCTATLFYQPCGAGNQPSSWQPVLQCRGRYGLLEELATTPALLAPLCRHFNPDYTASWRSLYEGPDHFFHMVQDFTSLCEAGIYTPAPSDIPADIPAAMPASGLPPYRAACP